MKMGVAVVFIALAAAGCAAAEFPHKNEADTPFLSGVWTSTKTDDSTVVEIFSLTQGVPDKDGVSKLATWGSLSAKNGFVLKGRTLYGPVTGAVSDDAKTIVWSHGYTSTLKSAKPVILEGLWQVYNTKDDGKSWTPVEMCSVEHRDEDVASFCENSLMHTYKYSDLTLKSTDGSEPDVTVSPCGGVVYSQEAGFVAKRVIPDLKDEEHEHKLQAADTEAEAEAAAKEAEAKQAEQAKQLPGAKMTGIAPAWVRGEVEKPEETKDMGGWKALVYSAEQQARLGVNEMGEQLEKTMMPLTMPGMVKTKSLRG